MSLHDRDRSPDGQLLHHMNSGIKESPTQAMWPLVWFVDSLEHVLQFEFNRLYTVPLFSPDLMLCVCFGVFFVKQQMIYENKTLTEM